MLTLVSSCATPENGLVVAWADMREGRSRIYYRRSTDGGLSWKGPASGKPLLPNVSYGDMHAFHPQIVCTTATGIVGCSFYVFGEWLPKQHLIQVQLAASWDTAASFSQFVTVTDSPWDPAVNAPFSHGDPQVTFIGEYFGLDAGQDDFALLWTDTRTGVQELYFDLVRTKLVRCPRLPELVAQILVGVVQDGGGWIIIGGKLYKVPPREPITALLELLAAEGQVESADVETIQSALRQVAQQAERGAGPG